MDSSRLVWLVSCALLAIAACTDACGAIISYTFSGTVQSVDADLQPTFAAGQTISGHFSIDSSPVSTGGYGAGSSAQYSVMSFDITFPGYFASASSGYSQVTNNGDYGNPLSDVTDFFQVIVGLSSAPLVNGYSVDHFGLFFETRGVPPVSALSGTALPTSGELAAFSTTRLTFLQFEGFRNVTANFAITVEQSVPEPASWTLIGIAFGGLLIKRRRLKRC
jgi:hypothetical protein